MPELESKKSNLVSCEIFLKTLTFPFTSDQKVKKLNNERKTQQLELDFYRLINKIVEVGGVISLSKYQLEYEENIVNPKVTFKIPEDAVQIISKMPEVQSFQLIQSSSENK